MQTGEMQMKIIALTLVAFGALTSVAYAQPEQLQDAQMDAVAAGRGGTTAITGNFTNHFTTTLSPFQSGIDTAASTAEGDVINSTNRPLLGTFTKADTFSEVNVGALTGFVNTSASGSAAGAVRVP
jgi:hypothetical protein